MSLNAWKTTETTANVAIIVVALVLGAVLVKRFLLPIRNPPAVSRPDPRVPPGTKISLRDIDWAKNQRTLILAISDSCHFCTESAEFYKALVQQKANKNSVHIVAVLPQTPEQGKTYLDKLGVSVDEIKQAELSSIGVSATPTLLMVDQTGSVLEGWVGKLPGNKEKEVLSRFQ